MLPPRLQLGDTIGLCSPSHLATEESYRPIIEALQSMGFSVQCAQNLFTHDWGYAASPENRAADVNELIRDDAVKLILFGGGEGAAIWTMCCF